MTIEKVLVVDDEAITRDFLVEILKKRGLEAFSAENGSKAVALIREHVFDLIITDMNMPGLTGIDVLKRAKELSPASVVVVITAFGTVENAVEAMRLGAFNYLLKPFSPDTIEALLEKAKEHLYLVEENHYLRQQASPGGSGRQTQIIAKSPVMKEILENIKKIAQSNASVFITGESGTGKEIIAHAIHTQSLRNNAPFIKVNCAAVPETLIESEFFGHEKGAFTGAHTKRIGRFELANHGTLLLDEVTEIPINIQAKLLRAIQEQEFERVGGNKLIKVDCRIISTSNRNIKDALMQKLLRGDLYYRLNVVPIHLPPLRERPEDIIPLGEYFLEKFSIDNHKTSAKTFSTSAKRKLIEYAWPGNIRELANVIERAVVMDYGNDVLPEHLSTENIAPQKSSYHIGMSLQELEKKLIIETLEAQNQNRTKSAAILGISIRTLRNKINEFRAAGINC